MIASKKAFFFNWYDKDFMVYGPCSSSLKSKIEYCQADQINEVDLN